MTRLLTVSEVMDLLQVSRTTAYGLIAKGELVVTRIGRAVRVHPRELDRLVQARSSGGDWVASAERTRH